MIDTFNERLKKDSIQKNSKLCIGLDIDPDRMPDHMDKSLQGIESHLKDIIDSTTEICLAYKLNMAFYEHTIVGKQDLSDKEMQSLIDKYSKIIDKSGKILKTEKWGLLNLANKIKKNKKGNFVHFKIEIEGKLVKEIEKQLSIDTNVIRYLTVKYDKMDLKNEFFGSKK